MSTKTFFVWIFTAGGTGGAASPDAVASVKANGELFVFFGMGGDRALFQNYAHSAFHLKQQQVSKLSLSYFRLSGDRAAFLKE